MALDDYDFAGRLIGVRGKARSGKDTVGEVIQQLRAETKLTAFARPIKEFCGEVFGWNDEHLYGRLKDQGDTRYPRVDGNSVFIEHLTPRYAMQFLGTEWGRECYREVWVAYAFRRAGEWLTTATIETITGAAGFARGSSRIDRTRLVVITDVRFVNEARAIKKAGGHVIAVERPKVGLRGPAAAHASEMEMDSQEMAELTDQVIKNNGTLAQLERRVEETLQSLGV